MQLGIDFGTSNTVVSLPDQGNFPVVSFKDQRGDWFDHYPSLIVFTPSDNGFLYGLAAREAAARERDITVIRSVKSLLKHNQEDQITLDGRDYSAAALLVGFLQQLHHDLRHHSNLEGMEAESFQVTIAVPAHSNNNQRFLTTDCFTKAGFEVTTMINEPSAVTLEYARSYFKNIGMSKRKYVLVYDLGGGTFDASVAEVHEQHHRIVATEGLDTIGGDQFDEILASLVLAELGQPKIDDRTRASLLAYCQAKKEELTPYSKNILLEWRREQDAEPQLLRIPVSAFYEACNPLIDQTMEVLSRLINRVSPSGDLQTFSTIYLVGGMSNCPLISRRLRAVYGNSKIKKARNCSSSVAIGLATLAAGGDALTLQETLTRYFGLWREEDEGQAMIFDPIFTKDLPLPKQKESVREHRVRYRPAHNIGIFRFQECSHLEAGQPGGLVTVWHRINFPFVAELQTGDLSRMAVQRLPEPLETEIEEIYTLNHQGEISVCLINHGTGYQQTFQLARIAGQ